MPSNGTLPPSLRALLKEVLRRVLLHSEQSSKRFTSVVAVAAAAAAAVVAAAAAAAATAAAAAAAAVAVAVAVAAATAAVVLTGTYRSLT